MLGILFGKEQKMSMNENHYIVTTTSPTWKMCYIKVLPKAMIKVQKNRKYQKKKRIQHFLGFQLLGSQSKEYAPRREDLIRLGNLGNLDCTECTLVSKAQNMKSKCINFHRRPEN